MLILLSFLRKNINRLLKIRSALKKMAPFDISLQNMSKLEHGWNAKRFIRLAILKDVVEVGEPSKDRLEANFKKFLELDSDKATQ